MEQEEFISKTYSAKSIEENIYKTWEESGYFIADNTSLKKPYCIIMPPPNVTGILHMGHALVNVIQDILVRFKRMSGFEVCWIPGTDHAGIATQGVVERNLFQKEGKKRLDYSRDEFLSHIWKWKKESEKIILQQLRKIGCSCDWSRLRFTMDEKSSLAVREGFKKLYDKNLIYRGYYLVNWDPKTQTALSDDEIEYEEKESSLWFFRYPFANDKTKYIVVATTRPETILGDVAVAVSSSDFRYKDLIGQKLEVPFLKRCIPIIGDHRVDPNFGSGAVKITPAHDFNDYTIGKDHHLPMINILNKNGTLNENAGKFQGFTILEARKKIIDEMASLGLLEKIEAHSHRVAISYRSKAIIEPFLSEQWFVKVKPFVPILRELVENHEIEIIPKEWKETYFRWVDNLRDWCISRQLWWGHRIPIWYHVEDPTRIICFSGEGIPPEVQENSEKWIQDPDVLDTWFSSGLWPMTCLGWPNKDSLDLEKFFPTTVLVTGHDILFFWVARMVIMSIGMDMGKPFEHVFLHGLIFGKSYRKIDKNNQDGHYIFGEEKHNYDQGHPLPSDVIAKWEKLSKSKGNVIDPLEMIELYGTDAVRMTLCGCANQSPQIDLDYRRFEENRNFVNKIWNGARFIFMNLKSFSKLDLTNDLEIINCDLEDIYIFSQLNRLIENMNIYFNSYQFDKAATAIYSFYWDIFCSLYIEIIKPVLFGKRGTLQDKKNKQQILVVVFSHLLSLMHPIAPFITEELFLKLKKSLLINNDFFEVKNHYLRQTLEILTAKSCMLAKYPSQVVYEDINSKAESDFSLVKDIIYVIRNILGEMSIPLHMSVDVFLLTENIDIEKYFSLISSLVNVSSIQKVISVPEDKMYSLGVLGELTIGVIIPEEFIGKEKIRLEKEKIKLEKAISSLEILLSNKSFIEKANQELVFNKRESLKKLKIELKEVSRKLLTQ